MSFFFSLDVDMVTRWDGHLYLNTEERKKNIKKARGALDE